VSYRFGTFEVLPDSFEMRECGVRMKLREQPFRILLTMLERPGQLVTREELQRLLWTDGTFVDFDKGLNTAVNKLREVLSDSAAQPRFIETIPRHGYRFIADVEKVSSAPDFGFTAGRAESIPARQPALASAVSGYDRHGDAPKTLSVAMDSRSQHLPHRRSSRNIQVQPSAPNSRTWDPNSAHE